VTLLWFGRFGDDLRTVTPPGSGMVGRGGAGGGAGVVGSALGNGSGVVGIGAGSGAGVEGIGSAGGVGVLAESNPGGTALKATRPGRLQQERRAYGGGRIVQGHQTGVALTPASLVLATLQQDVPGVWVRSAVPNVTAKSFTVHLSKAVSAKTKVAWFVLN